MAEGDDVSISKIESKGDRAHDQVVGKANGRSEAWDWDGPSDTDNPRNWHPAKKILHSAIPAIYGFAL
ncbi:hypothetical protein GQ44DRAFT_718299 [Phaeosphaeriaceae sp. PMI808]|nr:hypothetical protein GQ44DRAFT_718299 [Phaeosphaeriaceae sp. PMI808]